GGVCSWDPKEKRTLNDEYCRSRGGRGCRRARWRCPWAWASLVLRPHRTAQRLWRVDHRVYRAKTGALPWRNETGRVVSDRSHTCHVTAVGGRAWRIPGSRLYTAAGPRPTATSGRNADARSWGIYQSIHPRGVPTPRRAKAWLGSN